MSDFNIILDNYLTRQLGRNAIAPLSDLELDTVIAEAKSAKNAHASCWPKFQTLLKEASGLSKEQVQKTFRECRLIADLGQYPHDIGEFMGLFLASRGHKMQFSEEFSNTADADHIYNEMIVWNAEILGKNRPYDQSIIRGAFSLWRVKEQDRLLSQGYQSVAYDPNADVTAIARFARLMTAPVAGDSERTERNIRACEVALRNFIYRVKNHMRRHWRHSCHLMLIFYGKQGSGKTTAARHLLSPIREFSGSVGFDIFEHDAKLMKLSVTPVMFFDELAGISKSENERLKDLMHSESRELRKLYGQPVNRTLVSTFIGCTNKDISTLIRDETGNRRYLQIETRTVARELIQEIDPLAMWKSVDENDVAPMYAHAEDLRIINEVQSEQRHFSRVEHWLNECSHAPSSPTKSSDLFTEYFLPWCNQMYPSQERYENLINFGKELSRLIAEDHPRLRAKYGKTVRLYWLIDPAQSVPQNSVSDSTVIQMADQQSLRTKGPSKALSLLRSELVKSRERIEA